LILSQDPEGVTLKFIGKALEEHMNAYARCVGHKCKWAECGTVGYKDMGLFIDWCSLFQEPRATPAMLTAFKGSLAHINVWYAHYLTTVYFVTDEPDGIIPYKARGWTTFEYLISWLLQWKDWKPWNTIVFASGKPPPMSNDSIPQWLPPSPSDVDSFLDGEHADKIFTNGADRPLVARKFKEATEDIFGSVDRLNFVGAGWGPSDVKRLGKVLRFCTNLKNLDLSANRMGDALVLALVSASEELAELEYLRVDRCAIGDAGFAVMTGAVQMGVFPKLRSLVMTDNHPSPNSEQEMASQMAVREALRKACDSRRPVVRCS